MDPIDRQTAIDAVIDEFKKTPTNAIRAKIRIEALPPAQLVRNRGKWIRNDNGTYSCSVCHSWIPEEQHYYAQYCLYCGVDMRGE